VIDLLNATYCSKAELQIDFKTLDYATALALGDFWPSQTKNSYVQTIRYFVGPDIDWPAYGKFSWSVQFEQNQLIHIMLVPHFGPLAESAKWDAVSHEKLYKQIAILTDFVQNNLRRTPDKKRSSGKNSDLHHARWQMPWGTIEVSGESRSYGYGIFMTPH
jgi:hypothetical protein